VDWWGVLWEWRRQLLLASTTHLLSLLMLPGSMAGAAMRRPGGAAPVAGAGCCCAKAVCAPKKKPLPPRCGSNLERSPIQRSSREARSERVAAAQEERTRYIINVTVT